MAEKSSSEQLIRAAAMVTEMAVTIILGLLAGGWADRRFDTSPLFLFLLTLLAFILGMARLMRAIQSPRPPSSGPPDANPGS